MPSSPTHVMRWVPKSNLHVRRQRSAVRVALTRFHRLSVNPRLSEWPARAYWGPLVSQSEPGAQ
jgi:hypothetical protein